MKTSDFPRFGGTFKRILLTMSPQVPDHEWQKVVKEEEDPKAE